MFWVYAVPPGVLFVIVVGGMCALSGGGLLLFRRFAPPRDEVTHNDVAGPIIGTVGTVMAVILSFLLVTVWQEYDGAAGTMEQEVGAVSDLYHAAASFPEPVRGRLRDDLRTYVAALLTQEWPAMKTGTSSPEAKRASLAALNIVARYNPAVPSQQALQQDAIGLARTIQDGRRDRLFDNDQGIPVFFWIGNFVLATITIGLCYLFRVRSRSAHLLMTVALTAVIGTTFVLIALFDYPFRGDSQIQPVPFLAVQAEMKGDATGSSSRSGPARSRS